VDRDELVPRIINHVNIKPRLLRRERHGQSLASSQRVGDGLEAVQFLVKVKELIEDPGQMLIEL